MQSSQITKANCPTLNLAKEACRAMILSVLIIQRVQKRVVNKESISDEIQKLLESKISNLSVYNCTPDELDETDLKKYDVLLIQDDSIFLYLKRIVNHKHVINWINLSDLSLQLDVYVQLKRHVDQFPLDLENWDLTEVLYNSNDSIIYKAETEDGIIAAIKRYKFSPSTLSTSAVQKLLLLVDKQRQACCPRGLVKFYEGGVNNQAFYLVMEYLSYGSLRQALNGCGNHLPLTHALEWFQEIAIALDCVHKAGIIHRDLKIDNIQLRRDGSLVLTDFGVSKRLLLDAGFIYEGELHCSPHYVSPEQISGDACTQASDIYSLGVIFYELLTGSKPYSAEQAHELMMCHVMAPVPMLPKQFKQFQPLLDKMMAKNPRDRLRSALQAIDSLPIAA